MFLVITHTGPPEGRNTFRFTVNVPVLLNTFVLVESSVDWLLYPDPKSQAKPDPAGKFKALNFAISGAHPIVSFEVKVIPEHCAHNALTHPKRIDEKNRITFLIIR